MEIGFKDLRDEDGQAEFTVSDPVGSYRETVAVASNQICLAKSPNNVLSEAKEVNGDGRLAVSGQVLNGMESLREHSDGEPAELTSQARTPPRIST